MGFGREARRVRDTSLPGAQRFQALVSGIGMSQPIGFHATYTYLEAQVGRSRRDPEFLVPAVERLEDVLRRRKLLDAGYAPWRREQKARGRRFPARGEVTPLLPRRWHGDERSGAVHALRAWRGWNRDPELTRPGTVLAARDRALETGRVDDPAGLQPVLDRTRRQVFVVAERDGWDEYYSAWTTYRLLGQLHLLAFGEPVVGTVWNFTDG